MDVAMEQHPGGEDAFGFEGDPGSGDAGTPREVGSSAKAGDAADRLSTLTHELGGLLDGSMRWLGLLDRTLRTGDSDEDDLDRARKQLDTVRESLRRMAELVRTASGVKGPRFGFGGLGPGPSIAEAAHHALDVVRPRSAELGVSLGIRVDAGAGTAPAGPLYSVVLNGLRNAIESIEQCLGGQPGEGMVELRVRADGRAVIIEIEDDGIGPPMDGAEKVFEPGYTTRGGDGGGRGIGLSLSLEIVRELGGEIGLLARAGAGNERRPGAVLRVRVPAWESTGSGDVIVGGSEERERG